MPTQETLVPALVLDRRPFQDADWVLVLLTDGAGLVSALARGARGSRRRFAGSLDLFTLSRVRLRPPRGGPGMHLILDAECLRSYPGIWENLDRLEVGQGLLVLVRDLLREAPATEEVFGKVRDALHRLERVCPEETHEVLWKAFLELFASLGHSPEQELCPGCATPARTWKQAALGPDGVMRCAACASTSALRFNARALDRDTGPSPGDRRRTEQVISLWMSGLLGRSWDFPEF